MDAFRFLASFVLGTLALLQSFGCNAKKVLLSPFHRFRLSKSTVHPTKLRPKHTNGFSPHAHDMKKWRAPASSVS